VTMEDCVKLANSYGARVAKDLNIPIFLYENAARLPERKNLAAIRKGEYEGLKQKLQDPAWKPDFGSTAFNVKSGATVAGARKFLVAYNVNLNLPDASIAQEISLRIRESGRPLKNSAGEVVKNERGESVKVPGTLKAVKAMGVFLERFKIAQVSINLVDFETTPPHVAFEEVRKQARSLGSEVTGSEIVGLTPLSALLMAGRFYAEAAEASKKTDQELMALAIDKLGLSQLEPFDPEKKVIEFML
jgi:glutamate formiminotransferase/formiminotetrahydrofolate cyclodeaminase